MKQLRKNLEVSRLFKRKKPDNKDSDIDTIEGQNKETTESESNLKDACLRDRTRS
jgi:hypothetical protein